MTMHDDDRLKRLARLDPEIARRMNRAVRRFPAPLSPREIRTMADDLIWAFSQELSFGEALTEGLLAVMAAGSPAALDRYLRLVRSYGVQGPALGRQMAQTLVAVTTCADAAFSGTFVQVAGTMLAKGNYTLRDPFAVLHELLVAGETAAASAYLDFLEVLFSRHLTYNRSVYLTKYMPRAIRKLNANARPWQIPILTAAMVESDRLAESLVDGLERDLALLDAKGLHLFFREALAAYRRDPERGTAFAALVSQRGRAACDGLRVAVTLDEMRTPLNRYLSARIGAGVRVLPMSEAPSGLRTPEPPLVFTDGAGMFMADMLDARPSATENRQLYKCLARIECAVIEGGTYAFDICRAAALGGVPGPGPEHDPNRTDLEILFARYPDPELAACLFTIVEHGRVRRRARSRFPGAHRSGEAFVGDELVRWLGLRGDHPLAPLVAWSLVSCSDAVPAEPIRRVLDADPDLVARCRAGLPPGSPVEFSAVVLKDIYPPAAERVAGCQAACPALPRCPDLPFGRRLKPDLWLARHRHLHALAIRLHQAMEARQVTAYRGDLFRQLEPVIDAPTPASLLEAIRRSADEAGQSVDVPMDVLQEMMASVAPEDAGAGAGTGDRCGGDTYWYPEWDHRSQDYLRRHVRIRARTSVFSQTGVYGEVLHRRSSLVGSIRRAFERIRPQGVSILRRWMEGDDFDYRALLDFTVDRRMGNLPSQRIYIKRLKQRRDVAAMLLVDMSRSTAHPARGTGQSVMDVEKEAIVLFCEALGVLGDRFAVSGYSGAGRMGVEYFRIKGFDETMAPDVRARIGGMRPMRSTRTGAAIRHAAGELEAVDAGVRLLVVLGDGFPNDVDYKKAHAIEDTRKAVLEAHARRIHTHGITVNMVGDPGLDALFGATAHTVITDVRELPEKLWRVYSSLTKH